MKKSSIKRISAGILGLTSAATLGLAQQAQASTVKGTVDLNATNVTVTLDNADGTSSLIPLFFTTLEGTSNIGPFPGQPGEELSDAYNQSPISCPFLSTGMSSVSQFSNSAMSGSTVNCLSDDVANVASSAMVEVNGTGAGNAIGAYTITTQGFDVVEGDIITLDGLLELAVRAEVEGFIPDADITKTASADFLGTYEIFIDNELVFEGPRLDFAASLINENGDEVPVIVPPIPGVTFPITAEDEVTFLELSEPFTVGEGQDGQAEILFSVRTQASVSSIRPSVPEPSAVISLTALGVGALVSRKRKKSAK